MHDNDITNSQAFTKQKRKTMTKQLRQTELFHPDGAINGLQIDQSK